MLVKVRASTVNRADVHTREANRKSGLAVMLLSRMVSGLLRPRQPILGSEMAGEVVEVGAAVTSFKVGDRVFANTGFRFGCHAEYTAVPEASRIVPMPDGMSFEEVAPTTDGALNALWCLREGQVRAGERVLVYGASGAIGTAGVQLARHFGAHVTAVATAKTVDLVKQLGAEEAVDYQAVDFTKSGQTYDVIFDAVGKESFARTKGSLRPGGRYLATDGFRNLVLTMWTSRFGDRKVIFHLPPRYTKQDLLFLKELVEKGEYRPVIDRTYPLQNVVDAARYVETEQKVGNVVLTIADR